MPDPRSAMQEFRTLEAKRLAKGLSPEEERRHAQLRDLVGGEAGAGAPRGGFDVNAAAARLRESLLPAGLRNRPPPTPEVSPEPEPEPFFPAPEPAPAAEMPFDAAVEGTEGLPSFADGEAGAELFDPSLLGWEAEPGAAPVHDPAAAGAAWDPNAGWDPNALPLDAGGQPWDPNAAPWDPGAEGAFEAGAAEVGPAGASGWDPSAYGDPAAAQDAAQWDPNDYPAGASPDASLAAEPIDLSALGAELDGTFDPAALAGEEAAAPPWDGLEPARDPALSPEAPEPTQAFALAAAGPELGEGDGELPALELDGSALELEPLDVAALEPAPPGADDGLAGWSVPDTSATPEPTVTFGLSSEPEPTLAMSLAGDAAQLPPAGWDPAPAPEQAPHDTAFGAYDDLASSGAPPAFGDGSDTLAAEGDAGLDPALGFDPSAPPPVFAPAPGELGGEYDDAAGFAPGATFALPEADGLEAAPPALGTGAGEWLSDASLDQGFALASAGSFEAPEGTSVWAAAAAPAPWETAPAALPGEPSAPSSDAGDAAPEADSVTESHPLGAAAAAAPDDLALPEIVEEIPTVDGEEILEEILADDAGAPPPPLDFGAPPSPSAQTAAPAPAPAAPTRSAATAPVVASSLARSAAAKVPQAASAAALAAPAPAAAPPASPATVAAGSQRVVVHTLEGTVKRGVIEDADLAAPALALCPAPGAASEQVATDKVKAIFFMLAPGEAPPAAEGKKVRVTFRDGRQVAGFSPDYREDGAGFFMIPGDTRTNTGRIWVYRAAVKQVAVS